MYRVSSVHCAALKYVPRDHRAVCFTQRAVNGQGITRREHAYQEINNKAGICVEETAVRTGWSRRTSVAFRDEGAQNSLTEGVRHSPAKYVALGEQVLYVAQLLRYT